MANSLVETSFGYCEVGDDKGFFSSNERKWVNHMRKLAANYPNKCKIIEQPEDNDGYIYCKLPTSWLYVRPPVKREMTKEQRVLAAERLRKAREANKDD